FFFFSSRRRHTRFDCDWSSDVCSSDLSRPDVEQAARAGEVERLGEDARVATRLYEAPHRIDEERRLLRGALEHVGIARRLAASRSEERRVGKECRARGGADAYKNKSVG